MAHNIPIRNRNTYSADHWDPLREQYPVEAGAQGEHIAGPLTYFGRMNGNRSGANIYRSWGAEEGSVSPAGPNPRDCTYSQLQRDLRAETYPRKIDGIKGDGNCFYRALSKEFSGDENSHEKMRSLIVGYIQSHKNEFRNCPPPDNRRLEEHLSDMKNDGEFATELELVAAANVFNANLYVYTPMGYAYRWQKIAPFDGKSVDRYITLCHTNKIHFDRIVPLDNVPNNEYPPPDCALTPDY